MLAFIPDFMSEPWFIIVLIVIGLGLIGLLMFLRSKRSDDD
jgi:F0F1-type ATP synthase assembly protein I